jgi:hypothetical protein
MPHAIGSGAVMLLKWSCSGLNNRPIVAMICVVFVVECDRACRNKLLQWVLGFGIEGEACEPKRVYCRE